MIWKPANLTPASAVALTEIISRQDIPSGLFSLVMGAGREIGQNLVESPELDAISFTGSVPVGRGIAGAAIENYTKIQMEMGSKNALAVLDDAKLDLAVGLALGGAFGGSGQKCTASSRLVVHAAVHDASVEKLVAGKKALKVGHALAEGTLIGPVVSEEQLAANLAYVELGKSEGATLACGGERLSLAAEGYYMVPAVFIGTTNDMRINREEMFAPIASVIRVGSYAEALEVVNDTEFGLTSGHRHPLHRACHAFPAQCPDGLRHGQPAHRRDRLPRAVRGAGHLLLRPARAGTLRGRVLHHGQDRLYRGRHAAGVGVTYRIDCLQYATGRRRFSARCAKGAWTRSTSPSPTTRNSGRRCRTSRPGIAGSSGFPI